MEWPPIPYLWLEQSRRKRCQTDLISTPSAILLLFLRCPYAVWSAPFHAENDALYGESFKKCSLRYIVAQLRRFKVCVTRQRAVVSRPNVSGHSPEAPTRVYVTQRFRGPPPPCTRGGIFSLYLALRLSGPQYLNCSRPPWAYANAVRTDDIQ